MRHLKHGRKLNMSMSHRKAMLANLATSILDKERVVTTLAKAKEVRATVERLITHGKKGGVHAIRIAGKTIHSKTILKKLFDDIAPAYSQRPGGYTRIIKIGRRNGDGALMSMIELVGRNGDDRPRRKKKQPRAAAKKRSPSTAGRTAKDAGDAAPARAKKPASGSRESAGSAVPQEDAGKADEKASE